MGYSTGRRPWRSESPREPDNPTRSVQQKLFFLSLLVVLIFGIMTIQLARMQLVKGEKYALRAETNRLRELAVVPPRGLIYDRNGVPLVENLASYAAGIVAADVPKGRETEIGIMLQEMIGTPGGEVAAKVLERKQSNDPFTPIILKEDISQDKAFAIRERVADLPGVRVLVEARRHYVEGPLVSDVVGFVGRINEEEYDELQGQSYQPNDRLGKAGVEYMYEGVLRGLPGTRFVETDAAGREVRLLGTRPAQAGNSLVLSIDLDLQREVTKIIAGAMGRSQNAAAVVMDVRSGEVLALVSIPTFDNNIFTHPVDDATISNLLNHPGKPLVNHAIAEMYPPGSIFKQITGLAALQEGIAHAGTRITSLGSIRVPNQYDPKIVYIFRDWSALGTLDFYRGVAMSSDVYFYYLAGGYSENGREVFQGLGATTLARWTRRFGLGAKTGIDLPGESAGNVPDPDWKEETFGEPWVIGDTYNMGIGQGFVTATPIQMVRVTAAVANGGDVLVPRVVKEIRDGDGNLVAPFHRVVQNTLNIDPRNMNIMREGMRLAVADGTARTAASRNAQIAGKTGTAEFGERRPDGSYQEHGWFTGYGPFQNPEIAVAVFLEQGNGAGTAAPAAAKIFDYYFGRRALAAGESR